MSFIIDYFLGLTNFSLRACSRKKVAVIPKSIAVFFTSFHNSLTEQNLKIIKVIVIFTNYRVYQTIFTPIIQIRRSKVAIRLKKKCHVILLSKLFDLLSSRRERWLW